MTAKRSRSLVLGDAGWEVVTEADGSALGWPWVGVVTISSTLGGGHGG